MKTFLRSDGLVHLERLLVTVARRRAGDKESGSEQRGARPIILVFNLLVLLLKARYPGRLFHKLMIVWYLLPFNVVEDLPFRLRTMFLKIAFE